MKIVAKYKAQAPSISGNMTAPLMTALGGYFTRILVSCRPPRDSEAAFWSSMRSRGALSEAGVDMAWVGGPFVPLTTSLAVLALSPECPLGVS